MDAAVLTALIGAGGVVVGGGLASPVIVRILGRRQNAAQAALAEAQAEQHKAQAEQLKVQTGLIRQDIYQQITQDLGAELERVKRELRDARESLRLISVEAERLRLRVVELESRIAQLELTEQHLSAELRATQTERDQLRIQLAAKEATISQLQQQIGDLKAQTAGLQAPAAHNRA